MIGGAHEGFGRLDVAVGDAVTVGVVEGLGELADQVDDARQRDRRIVASHLAERLAFEELHDEVVLAVVLGDIEELDDVRVAEAGRQTGLR